MFYTWFNASKCFKMLQNAFRCSRMCSNGLVRCGMMWAVGMEIGSFHPIQFVMVYDVDYLEVYDVSFRHDSQVSHVILRQQQQSLSCDVVLIEDIGVLLHFFITCTTQTHICLS